MTPFEALLIAAGAFAGGFASGLSGFGFSLLCLSLWLQVLSPQAAVPLAVLSSIASQLLTLPLIWRTIDWRSSLTFILPGLVGIPIGAAMLAQIPQTPFKIALGVFLVGYAGFALMTRARPGTAWGGRVADAAIGLAGGFLGGIAALSGSIMSVWGQVRGWSKEMKRGVFQAFNFSMLAASAVGHAVAGLHGARLVLDLAIALPVALAAAWLGHRVFERMSDRRFDRAILWLLLIAGVSLLVTPGR
jgi:hypothetical protein